MSLSEISKIIIFLNFFYFFEIFKTYRFLWKFSKILYILWISGKNEVVIIEAEWRIYASVN